MNPHRCLALVVSTTLFMLGILCSCRETKGTTSLDDFVEEYNLWVDPSTYQTSGHGKKVSKSFKTGSIKVKKMLSPACKITLIVDNKASTLTVEEFINGLQKASFMMLAQQIVMDKPKIEKRVEHAFVSMTKGFTSREELQIAECELIIDTSSSNFLITNIKRHYRKPKLEEITKVKKAAAAAKYDPKKGLGARYLGWPGGLFDVSLDISPDGNKIVYTSLRDDSSEIYLVNINGSNVQRLTNTQYWEINPVFAPEGKGVLFFSDIESYSGHCYYIDLDSRDIKKIGSEFEYISEVCYSHNGKMLGIIGNKGDGEQVYICDITSNKIWPVTTNEYEKNFIVFSNDDELICFTQKWYDHERSVEIFSSKIDGLEVKQLTNDKSNKKPVAITSNHEIIYIKSNKEFRNEIYIANIQGNNHKYIYGETTNGVENLCLSPDEEEVLFIDDKIAPFKYDIYALDLKKETLRRLTYESAYIFDYDISADGKYLIYMKDKKGAPKRGKCEIYLTPIDTWSRKLVTKNY